MPTANQQYLYGTTDSKWVNITITDGKFEADAASPPRYRREGNVVRLAGILARSSESALAEYFAKLPEALWPNKLAEGGPVLAVVPVGIKDGSTGEGGALQIDGSDEGKLTVKTEIGDAAKVSLDGVTYTLD